MAARAMTTALPRRWVRARQRRKEIWAKPEHLRADRRRLRRKAQARPFRRMRKSGKKRILARGDVGSASCRRWPRLNRNLR